ncbi:MAG TPA: hypothetical protein VLA37_11190 [Sphingomonadaceae bacterium]|nr:hypothetical protein [Sphingomonadaceae bacterium]
MSIKSGFLETALIALAALTLAGCQQQVPAPEESADAPGKLPISMNAVMVSVVDSSADYVFALGNGDLPKNDHDWDMVRSASYELVLSGELTKMEGTGANDAAWAADTGWQNMAQDLSTIGQEALALAEARSEDVEAWRGLADRLVTNCLACHEAFKPEIPSEGILHESTERESRGESIFD